MMRAKFAGILAALLIVCCAGRVFAGASDAEQLKELRDEVAKLRDQVAADKAAKSAGITSPVDTLMANKYGPDAEVTTRTGKLEIGGLVQVWYYNVQRDSRGLFDSNITGIRDTNAASDNSSFRIRRAELRFKMDIHENVSAFVMIDPAAEASSFPQLAAAPKRLAYLSPEFAAQNAPTGGFTTAPVQAVQEGGGIIPTLLQDALINFHGVLPHHDVTTGQMKTTFNEENFLDNGNLDFVERSYIANLNTRDLGAVIHGSWWCNGGGGVYQGAGDTGRLQYWVGAYDGAGNLHGTAGSAFNRSDDNDHKDLVATLLVRPIWDDCWGKLELGASARGGTHGKDGNGHPASNPSNGLDRQKTYASGYDGWAKYYAPGIFKGLWFKGEAQWLHDRNAPSSIVDLAQGDFQNAGDQAQPYSTFGFWASAGYKLRDSQLFCDCGDSFWKNLEVAFRYESAPNVTIAKPTNTTDTNVYQTKIYTSGINYYIKGDHAKLQLNYNILKNPHGPLGQPFHDTRNDSLVLNFQVMW